MTSWNPREISLVRLVRLVRPKDRIFGFDAEDANTQECSPSDAMSLAKGRWADGPMGRCDAEERGMLDPAARLC